MSQSHIDLPLADSNATEALGAALAQAYRRSGGGSGIVYLHGELGAGKTTCVRRLLHTLGVEGAIRSPTYTLVEVYPLPGLTCVHVDLYRVHGPGEVDELGLRDFFSGDCLLLVEWPERGVSVLPPADLDIQLSYAGEQRMAQLSGRTARGAAWLLKLENDPS